MSEPRKIWPGITPGTERVAKRASPSETLGSSNVLNSVGGYVVSEDRNPDLRGDRRYITYDNMVRDTSIVAAGVRLFLNLISDADWTVNPPEGQEDNKQAQDIAAQCYDMLFDMRSSWASVVRKTAMYRFQGFSVLEWTSKKRTDGAVGFKDIANRPQRSIVRWEQEPDGNVTACFQKLASGNDVRLPREKIVYAVDDILTESPEGVGLYRHLAETADRLKRLTELEEVGYETDLRGIPIARAPFGELKEGVDKAASVSETAAKAAMVARDRLLNPLKEFINKHVRNKKTGLMLPSDTYISTSSDARTATTTPKWNLELLNGDSSSFAEIADAINRMTQELARVLGVEHLLLGADGGGSLALAQSKVGTFYVTLSATLQDLVEIFERDIIEVAAILNGWPEELIPTLGVAEIRDQDVSQVTEALRNLAQAGAPISPLSVAVGEIFDMLGLTRPDPETDFEDAALPPVGTTPNDPASQDKPMDQRRPTAAMAKRRIITSTRARQRAAKLKKAA